MWLIVLFVFLLTFPMCIFPSISSCISYPPE